MADQNFIGGVHYEMMRRCYNPKCVAYGNYGAKGIKVCDEWHDKEVFKSWANENGFQKGLRLCRKDNSKDYTPDNCFFGEGHKAKSKRNQEIKRTIKENKEKKASIGVKRLADSPLRLTYYSMHTRCENPNHKYYKHYGGRGITVCDEWSGKDGIYNFIKWAQTNGWEEGLTLDRINNDKGYSPDNCHWTTTLEQFKNSSKAKKYDYKGLLCLASEIAFIENISVGSLRYRLNKGIPLPEAIEQCKSLRR